MKETRDGKGKKKLNFKPKPTTVVISSSSDYSENEKNSDDTDDQSSNEETDGYDSAEESNSESDHNFIESDGSEYEKDDFVGM